MSGVDLDPNGFIDVPLQYTEGRALLELIGLEKIPIPQSVMQEEQETGAQLGHQLHQSEPNYNADATTHNETHLAHVSQATQLQDQLNEGLTPNNEEETGLAYDNP
jgi:hypothetical protein